MPTRTPIIPNALGNKILVRALHHELQEKKLLEPNISTNQLVSATSSSGIHSDSSTEDTNNEKALGTLTRNPKARLKAMGGEAADGVETRKSKRREDSSDSENSDDRSTDSERSDDTTSSSEEENEPTLSKKKRDRSWLNEHLKDKIRNEKLSTYAQAQPRNKPNGFVANQKRGLEALELTERDKQEIRDGYKRFVLNGERPPTGTSFGAKMSTLNKVTKHPVQVPVESSQALTFPLEDAASGGSPSMGIKDAKRYEKAAKHKTRIEKRAIAEAKLTVSEAKLTEFEAKLRARQARIDERHAKLCHRRAIIKRAEERLQSLEARLDEEEECQRERERKVKNRERRVKQEEAGIQIKEASLKKREAKVTSDIKDIERRKKLVEEKESMSSTMKEIMSKREALYQEERHDRDRGKGKGNVGTLERLLGKPKKSHQVSANYASLGRKNESSTNYVHDKSRYEKTSSNYKSTAPIPIPRKSLESRDSTTVGRKKRSNSLDSESVFSEEDSSRSGRPNGDLRQEKFQVGSLPRQKNKSNAVMGLWL